MLFVLKTILFFLFFYTKTILLFLWQLTKKLIQFTKSTCLATLVNAINACNYLNIFFPFPLYGKKKKSLIYFNLRSLLLFDLYFNLRLKERLAFVRIWNWYANNFFRFHMSRYPFRFRVRICPMDECVMKSSLYLLWFYFVNVS
jgi:hypothetical protein